MMLVKLCGCNQRTSNFSFEKSYLLSGAENKNSFLYKGGQLLLYDTLLIVTSTPQTLQCLHIFNKNNLRHIKSIGNIGKGEGEITRPGSAVVSQSSGTIFCPDLTKKKILEFDLRKMMENKETFLELNFIKTPFNPFIGQYHCINDSLFSFRHSSPDTLISFFNDKGAILVKKSIPDNTSVYDYRKIDPKIFNSSELYLYCTSPNLKKIAIAYRYSDTFQILDTSGTILKTLKGPNKTHQIPEIRNFEQKRTYKQLQTDENYIYCLYSGEPLIIKEETGISINYAQKLHIFDWNGAPVAELTFDKKVSSFVVDSSTNDIITFCPETGNIRKYQLPKKL